MNTSTLTTKQQFWLNHIQNAEKFDGSLNQYAIQYDLKRQDIYRWRNQLRTQGIMASLEKDSKEMTPSFAKVVSSPTMNNAGFNLRFGSLSISTANFPDPKWLAELIQELEHQL